MRTLFIEELRAMLVQKDWNQHTDIRITSNENGIISGWVDLISSRKGIRVTHSREFEKNTASQKGFKLKTNLERLAGLESWAVKEWRKDAQKGKSTEIAIIGQNDEEVPIKQLHIYAPELDEESLFRKIDEEKVNKNLNDRVGLSQSFNR